MTISIHTAKAPEHFESGAIFMEYDLSDHAETTQG